MTELGVWKLFVVLLLIFQTLAIAEELLQGIAWFNFNIKHKIISLIVCSW